MFTFQPKYFILAILLFTIEVLIAIFVNDRFIRPYGGDFIVVILVYCFVRSFWKGNVKTTALAVLIFAYVVEISQYFKLVKFLGLQKSKLANVVLGNSFAWVDILAYTLGILFVLFIEKMRSSAASKKDTTMGKAPNLRSRIKYKKYKSATQRKTIEILLPDTNSLFNSHYSTFTIHYNISSSSLR